MAVPGSKKVGSRPTNKEWNERELLAYLEAQEEASIGGEDTQISRERLEVMRAYRGETPEQKNKGRSAYVSTDVYDSTEAMHAQLLETFTGGTRPVAFDPKGPDDVVSCEGQTAYCEYVIHQQNPGYTIFSDVIKDGLMARLGVVKAWWNELIEEVEFSFPEPLSKIDFIQYITANPEATVVKVEPDEDDPELLHVTVANTVDKSQVKIVVIPPHEFSVSSRARSLMEATFTKHTSWKTLSELLALGIDEKLAREAIEKDGDASVKKDWYSVEDAERFNDVDAGAVSEAAEDLKRVELRECYIRADLEGNGRDKIWKVFATKSYVLDKEAVQRHPFVGFTPIRIPHSAMGQNFAKSAVQTQKLQSHLVRAVADHTAVTVTPRFTVLNGALRDPKELMDPRLGGIVNVNRQDAVTPLVQPPLNPYVFNFSQMLDQKNESTTGISRLSQGLNKDAVSKQNSSALVEQLVTNSQIRQKIIARNFAHEFLIPLYNLVSQLVVENEKTKRIIQVAGEWTEVNPQEWASGRDCTASVHLGYGEADREVEKWMMLHQLSASDPMMQGLYGPQQRWAVFAKIYGLKGVKDVATFLGPQAAAKPPQPDPLQQAEIKLKQTEADIKMKQIELEMARFNLEAEVKRAQLQIDAMVAASKQHVDQTKLVLENKKIEYDHQVDNAEIEAMNRAKEITAVASPNG